MRRKEERRDRSEAGIAVDEMAILNQSPWRGDLTWRLGWASRADLTGDLTWLDGRLHLPLLVVLLSSFLSVALNLYGLRT